METEAQSGGQSRHLRGNLEVLWSELACMMRTLGMLFRGELATPDAHVGRVIRFANETTSEIYRETVVRPRDDHDLILLVVRFRLKWIGLSRFAHALFRYESILNTVLFAAHPGFQTKLWCTDRVTGFYRGIYEWQGRVQAMNYAETLRVVLRPWARRGSFAYRIIENVSREDYLAGAASLATIEVGDGWWLAVPSEDRPDEN